MDWKGYQDDEELRKAEKTFSKNKYEILLFVNVVFIVNTIIYVLIIMLICSNDRSLKSMATKA